MSAQSWQVPCPRCGWANSGALLKCAKCGQPLGARPGMLVAGQSVTPKAERPVLAQVAKPGGFLPRLIAYVIDSVILGVVTLPIYALWTSQLQPVEIKAGTNIAAELAQRQVSFRVAILILWTFYFAGSWAMLGATPGQRLLSLRVTDGRAAGIGFFRAFFRALLMFLFGPLSLITVLITKQKRAIHDMLVGTFVIQVVPADELLTKAAPVAATAGIGPAPYVAPIAASPAPAPAPAPAATAVVAAAPVSAPTPAAVPYSPPPMEPPAAEAYVPPPAPAAVETYSPPPAPTAEPYSPPPAPGSAGSTPMEFPPMPMTASGLEPAVYEPPTLPEPPREMYSPQPAQVSERAAHAAAMYAATTPEVPAPDRQGADPAEAADPAPAEEGEPLPFEFPPMAPPPK